MTKALADVEYGFFSYICITGELPSFYFTSKKEEDADPEMIARAKRKGTFCLFEVESLETLHLALAAYMEREAA